MSEKKDDTRNGQTVRVSKEDRKKLAGKTNWAALISEEKKDQVKKS